MSSVRDRKDNDTVNDMVHIPSNVSENELRDNVVCLRKLIGTDNNMTTNDIFKLLDLIFKKRFYAYRHLHDSYNKFIDDILPTFFSDAAHVFSEAVTNNKMIRHKFEFKNIRFDPPKLSNNMDPMFPADARHLAVSYMIIMYADVTQFKDTIDFTTDQKTQIQVGVTEKNKPIMIIPAMVRSKYCNLSIYPDETQDECSYDPGGYFIIGGLEKIIICQDRMIHNNPLVYVKKNSNASFFTVQVNSKAPEPNSSMQSVVSIRIKKDNEMLIKIPFLQEVNVMIIFRLLGVETDREIIEMCSYDLTDNHMVEILRASIDGCMNDSDLRHMRIRTQEDAMDYLIGKLKVINRYVESNQKTKMERKKIHLMELIKKSFLPHIVGADNPYRTKAYYVGYMINRLLKVYMGRAAVDNRDSYCKKRVDNVKELLEEIMMQHYKSNMAECNKQFIARMGDNFDPAVPYNVIHQFKASAFEQGFRGCLMLGNWPRRKGVAQMLQRYSYLQLLTFLTRIESQGGGKSSSKLMKPRYIDPSSIPFLCTAESPEHNKIGLEKHLTLISSITIDDRENTEIVREYIVTSRYVKRIDEVKRRNLERMYKVFLNGEWLGVIDNTYEIGQTYDQNPTLVFYAEAKVKKISGTFHPQMTSIVMDHAESEIRFFTDAGRFYRPIIRCNGDNEMMLTREHIDRINKNSDWNDIYMTPPYPIEFIDTEEQPYLMIAEDLRTLNAERSKILNSTSFHPTDRTINNRYDENFFVRYDGVELHPSVLLGVVITNVPFANHNNATRVIYQYSHARAAMNVYCTTYRARTDISYLLYNPDIPIVGTRTAKYTHSDILPSGTNAIVAIACYTGYNQEDSLIFNKTAIERGLFRSMNLKNAKSSITKNQETSGDDKFMKPAPDKTIGIKNGRYEKLNEHGFVPEETVVTYGDVIFGKVTPIADATGSKLYKDSSEQYKSHAPGVIDRVYLGIKNQDGFETRRALVRSERVPSIGDKFCCYTSDHQILTDGGWIHFTDLTTDHRVASMTDNRLSYVNPITVQRYDYEGQIYEIDTTHIKLAVTPNHRMLIARQVGGAFEIKRADQVAGISSYYTKSVVSYDGGGVTPIYDSANGDRCIEYAGRQLSVGPLLALIGSWYVGGTMIDGRAHINGWVVSAHYLKLGITVDTETLTVSDRWANDMFDSFGESFPAFVWNLQSSDAHYLFQGMMDGMYKKHHDNQTRARICDMDHDKDFLTETGVIEYVTVSKIHADEVQRLCLHVGYWADILTECVGPNTKPHYKISIHMLESYLPVNDTEKGDQYTDYRGSVHCCQVPGQGIIYVRRNGCPVWSGNSRHGQKGTIGITLNMTDMPFTRHGIRPDIILNPNAIPKRMTVSQLWECLFGKLGALQGHNMDATAFEDYDIDTIQRTMESLGYRSDGKEYLYNGMTGQKMNTHIFIGPTYYQRLKHMVQDKFHSRARGTVTHLTRQAPEGRARDGGMKVGEMERDAIIAHGMSKFMKERFMDCSDEYSTYVCGICGLFARREVSRQNEPTPGADDIYYCPTCSTIAGKQGNYSDIHRITIPYAFKLLVQELMAMNIAPRIRVQKNLAV